MFKHVFVFEIKYRFSRPGTWVYFFILFIVPFLLFGFGNTPASEKVYHNSPINIANFLTLVSFFGILIASAIMSVPLYRDLEHKTANFLYTYPISRAAYFMGRFWGSFVVLLFISLGPILGIFLGSIVGPTFGIDPLRYGPNEIIYYLQPWLILILPNLWLGSSIFFSLIILTKNVRSIYTGGIVLFIFYLVANLLSQNIENKDLVKLIDPIGLNSLVQEARYLTPYEQNTFLLAFDDGLLINRVIWICIAFVFFILSYLKFSFSDFIQLVYSNHKKGKIEPVFWSRKSLEIIPDFSFSYHVKSFRTLIQLEVKNIINDNYFKAILLVTLVFLVLDFWVGDTNFGVPNIPSTSFLMEFKTTEYKVFVFIIIVFFIGESLHRDKSTGFSKINDSFPVKDSLMIASKFLAIGLLCFFLTSLPILVGLIIQTLKGFFEYNFKVYLIDSFLIGFPEFLQMAMLVFAVHLIVNNKFAGHGVAISIWLSLILLRRYLGFDFNLFLYSYKPSYIWSDMNGLGHFADSLFWFNLYWSSWGIFILLLSGTFYTRGTESSFYNRLIKAKSVLFSRSFKPSFIFLFLALFSGAFIYKSVVYENNYLTKVDRELRQLAYEIKLKKYQGIPQPKYVSIDIKADLFPRERDASFIAEVQLVNKGKAPIDSVHFNSTSLSDFKILKGEDTLKYRFPLKYDKPSFQIFRKKPEREWYKITALPTPLLPGDTIKLTIVSEVKNTAFPNSGYGRELVYNGSFISDGVPDIGYDSDLEIKSEEKRRKYHLPINKESSALKIDSLGSKNLLVGDEADLIYFEAIVSTIPSQIAIAPGYLQKEWIENERRYFHYVQDTPIQNFFTFISADYEVLKSKTSLPSGKEVAIEIYYDRQHPYNLDRFLQAYQDGLSYFSETYGDFQFDQMRLLEFPRYADFAQSFPNTVPFSEDFGWVADFSDPDDFDYVYYTTAHELAHQWWGHQITPNSNPSSNLLAESLAEYSALILSERRYGKNNMKRFLMEQLDKYLVGRANESIAENTFIESNRPYQWYFKGSIILYGLRDLIGDKAMDSALYAFNRDFGLRKSPPFPGSSDLYRYLESVTPDSLHYYLQDTWKKITLYDNRAESVEVKKLSENLFEVTLLLNSQKLYADENGKEIPAEYDGDYIDIGIFASASTHEKGLKNTSPLYLEKHKIKPGINSFTMKVKGVPKSGGIDPFNKLIDRIPDDNVIEIEVNN
ncbi:ABC transporter permease/M1 family aminopeptidase [Algoriphagus marincola]|uniref:ABC transporter permease/M1 family aminopeptidase n=1 Tax=Algoriphagus marincola TaxID=264027 RepID=UPI00040964CC|nr:M1 family aminopeptidase [Algoriphagus marincola]